MSAAPHVLLTSDAVGGVWRYSMAVAEGLCAAGGRCTLVTMGPAPSPQQREGARGIAGCTLIETDLALDWTAAGRHDMAAAAGALDGLATEVQARTVHLHMPGLAAFPWTVPAVCVAHSCVGGWWRAVHGDVAPPAAFRWRMDLMREGLDMAACVIAPSSAAAHTLRAVYGVRRRIEIIHNGLAAMPSPPQTRARRVLTAGRLWDAGKNVGVLDRAARRLDAPVDAAGPAHGPDGAVFVGGALNLVGTLSQADLHATMARTAIFAAPSIYEPFGLAVLEAAQTGAALVLSDIPGFRELWDGAAVFVDAHDAQAWAVALGTLLDAPAQAAQLGDRARLHARRYSAHSMVAATMAHHHALALQAA